MTAFVDEIKESIVEQTAALAPQDDLPPALLYRDHEDKRHVVIMEMGDEEEKSALAALMSAVLLLDRAVEAIFVSMVWVSPDDGLDVLPVDRPDRREAVIVMHYLGGAHEGAVYSNLFTRHDDRAPELGGWVESSVRDHEGRFARALHHGLYTSEIVPEGIAERIRHLAQTTGREQALAIMAGAFARLS